MGLVGLRKNFVSLRRFKKIITNRIGKITNDSEYEITRDIRYITSNHANVDLWLVDCELAAKLCYQRRLWNVSLDWILISLTKCTTILKHSNDIWEKHNWYLQRLYPDDNPLYFIWVKSKFLRGVGNADSIEMDMKQEVRVEM